MRDLQPFTMSIRCGQCVVSPAKQGVVVVCSCPSAASWVAVCAPSQSESSGGSHLKSKKVLKKRSFYYFNKGENFKPYKSLNKVNKIIL